MNALAPRRAVGTTDPVPEAAPVMRPPSPELAEAMALAIRAREARSDNHAPMLTRGAAAAVSAEARRRLEATEAALATRPDAAAVHAWIMRLVNLIGHPRDADEIAAKLTTVGDALAGLPRRCLTKASAARVAMEAGDFFPPLARLLDLLRPEADALRAEQHRLARVLAVADPPEPSGEPEPSPEERAAVAARARALAAELTGGGGGAAPGGRPLVRPLTLSPERALAEFERIAREGGPGAGAAQLRVEALRRQMGGAA